MMTIPHIDARSPRQLKIVAMLWAKYLDGRDDGWVSLAELRALAPSSVKRGDEIVQTRVKLRRVGWEIEEGRPNKIRCYRLVPWKGHPHERRKA